MTALLVLALFFTTDADLGGPVRWMPPGEVAATVIGRSDLKPIPGVTVTLTRPDGTPAWTAVTDSSGRVQFRGVAAGSYTLVFELSGFARMQIGPFEVGPKPPRIPEFLAVLNPVMWEDGICVGGEPHESNQ